MELFNDNCNNVLKELDLSNCIIVSDPPFNVNYHYDTYEDSMNEEDYLNWMKDIFTLCPSVIIHYPETLYKICLKMGEAPVKVCSWVYNSMNPRQHRDIAFFGVKPNFNQVKQPYKNPNDKRIKKRIEEGKTGGRLYDWWNINIVKNVTKNKCNNSHPCVMPLEVMKNIVGILPKGKTIVDPFMGSGTTGVACKELGYDFIGIELDESYFNIAKERIENVLDTLL